ncbi:MAG TPA: ABC transporter permease [Vicinamibacterales bacterium]|jgi:putative ABC transport system permease protein|nr:ABC transporter permease [Vicinamibacterales bacterium]
MLTEIRHAVRTLAKTPTFSAIAILTIAIGIAANTAIFSVVNGVLLRPLPFHDAGRIVQVWTATNDESRSGHSAGDFLDLQRENRSFTAMAGYRNAIFAVMVGDRDPQQFEGNWVTVDFFDILGVRPAAGRVFSRAQDATPAEPMVVISDAVWQRAFNGSQDAVGTRVRLNGEPHTVVGVMPPRAEWPEVSKLWILSGKPVPPSPVDVQGSNVDRDVRYFEAIARLKPGVSLEQAADDMGRVGADIQKRHPATAAGRRTHIGPIREQIVGDVRAALLVLQGAVGLVLLVACANVSGLLVARATGRRRELAIRAALGASPRRLVRQLLTESLALGIAGGALGLLLASWLVRLLLAILPRGVPRVGEITLDPFVAGVTLLTSLATAILFGVLPAIQGSRADAGAALRQDSGRTTSARAQGRAVLVVAEVALTLVLLVGAGLLINSFLRLQRVESGMRPERVSVMGLMLPQSRYPKAAAQTGFYRRVIEGLKERPEVQAVGVGFPGPLRGSNASGHFFIEGHRTTSRADQPFANLATVSGGYFAAAGIPLISGRTFTDADREDAASVGIVSAALARRYWPGENPVGKRFRFDEKDEWGTVVGIVGDVRQLGLHLPPPPILYMPYEQFPLPFTNIMVRGSAPETVVWPLVRAQITSIDPQLPPGDLSSMQNVINRSVAEPRFRSLMLGAFALMALILAAVGLYGLISYSVTQRTREIGIRVALGAEPREVLTLMLREGLVLSLVGIAAGLVGALIAARALSRFLFGVGAGDPMTFALVSITLLLVATIASYLPARRALAVNPVTALRAE